jgi:putative Mg2+ transporter-C (MgtC) family protein
VFFSNFFQKESFIELLISSTIKLLTAAGLGASIGLEREIHGRAAGLRTNTLVCVASCLLIVVSRSNALHGIGGAENYIVNADPARMAAGVMTGIGFLGAGAILHLRESLVRGLTTAAAVWFVAAIGISVGLEAYGLSVVATIIGLIILIGLNYIDGVFSPAVDRKLSIDVELSNLADIENMSRKMISGHGIGIRQASCTMDNIEKLGEISFEVSASNKNDTRALVAEISALPGVRQIHWT